MADRIRIIKKNNPDSLEYSLGDEFEIDSTWYGGANVTSKTGIPLCLDKDEYEMIMPVEQSIEAVIKANEAEVIKLSGEEAVSNTVSDSRITVGDIVAHFKREWVDEKTSEYLYKVLAFASHTETGEKLVIYQAMYAPFKTCARPYEMFMSEVDREKYPNAKQKYRFEKIAESKYV